MKFKTYLIFFLLLGVLPDVFIGLVPLGGAAWWWRLLPAIPTAAALWYLVLIGWGVRYTASLRAFSYFTFIFLFPKFLFLLVWLLVSAFSKAAASWVALASALALSAFFTTLIFHVSTHLRVKHTQLTFSNLPPTFDGLRIVQLCDFHLGSYGDSHPYVRRIVEATLAQKPDLILFTGDLVNFDSREADSYLPWLRRLEAPLGIIAIRGNHDYLLHRHGTEEDRLADTLRLLQLERDMGWKLLLNENIILEKEGQKLAIAGVENISTSPYFPDVGGDLDKALAGIPEGCFTILLSHDPTHWAAGVAGKAPVDLTLSGHTHGLRYKLAGMDPSNWEFHHYAGIYRSGSQVLNVCVGLGSSFAFRLGGYPCVEVITLKQN